MVTPQLGTSDSQLTNIQFAGSIGSSIYEDEFDDTLIFSEMLSSDLSAKLILSSSDELDPEELLFLDVTDNLRLSGDAA